MHTNINANTSITSTTNIEATQRDYLVSRLRNIKRELRRGLENQFHLYAQAAPKSAKALVEAIKNDEFSFDEKLLSRTDEDELRYYNNLYGIIWGKDTPDRDGFRKADAALDVRYQEALDAATLGPIDQAQQVIKDFQDWKYTE